MKESKNKPDLIVILGPTASGKTRLAVQLASLINGEIISADSRQVYKNMDIGTGKDLSEYHLDGKDIPYHLINICEAGEKYNLARFQSDFFDVYQDIRSKNTVPILCGGSGLYIQSVLSAFDQVQIPVDETLRKNLEGLDTEKLLQKLSVDQQIQVDTSTRKRIIRGIEMNEYLKNHPGFEASVQRMPVNYRIYGLNPSVEVRRKRISERLRFRLEQQNMTGEVESLLGNGLSPETLIYYGLEYKLITQFLTDELDYETMVSRLETEIHRFAKRQMTFFRSMEKKGFIIKWFDENLSETEILNYISGSFR